MNYVDCCKSVTIRGRSKYKIGLGSLPFEGPAPTSPHPPDNPEVGTVNLSCATTTGKRSLIYFEDERGRPRRSSTISGALCCGNSLNSSRCSTATSSISCHVRVASRQRRRARFVSRLTISTPTSMPNTNVVNAVHTVIGSTVKSLTNRSQIFSALCLKSWSIRCISVVVATAGHTRLSLADRISSTKAKRKRDHKSNNQIHY